MLVVGYQGIGKSSLGKNRGYIDLESSLFNRGIDCWVEQYVEVAKHLSDDGYCVLLSAHGAVREYMDKLGMEYMTVSPDLSLRMEWIDKLAQRYKETKLRKDLRALERAKNYYKEDVKSLQEHRNHLILKNMDYNLYDLLFFTIHSKECKNGKSLRETILYHTKIICSQLGYQYDYVVTKKRYANIVKARVEVTRRLSEMGFCDVDIAYALGVNHSTICYYRNRYVDYAGV